MPSIRYDAIYSRFFTKVEAFDLVDEDISEKTAREFLCNYLHSAVYDPYVRRLFASVSMNDSSETLEYEISYEIGTDIDQEFLLELLAYGMAYAWIEPKVQSLTAIAQTFGTSDLKFYSEANHIEAKRNLRDDLRYRIRRMISDRGYLNNKYLDGAIALRPQ